MITFYKRYWRTAFDIALIALTVWVIMYVFSFLYKIAAPVFMSFLIFACIEPLAKRLNRIGIKKAIASAISVLFFTLVILGAFIGAGVLLTYEIMEFVDRLPDYQTIFTEEATYWIAWLQSRIDLLPEGVVQQSQSIINSITGWGQRVATQILVGFVNFLSSLSTFVFNFGIGIILAYFLSIEIDMWKKLAREKTPNTFKTAFYFLKDNVLAGIVGYLKSQFILVSITFVVILTALMLLGVNNAFTIAALSAIADILPLLGVTTVFAPWIIYLFIVGQTQLAIWLTVILGVVLLTRQILEPKITGGTLGVSAYTMLVCMLVSLSLFGVAGVILSPVLVILIKQLHAQGYLRRWIRPPLDYDNPPADPPAGSPNAT
ncbi:Sporulation integral membrane protein YtvI [Thermobacillus xylanilyticus]|uniref:Sporulation integral membrane protein YtvI n=1 Tax=Thermobacillus xylanilyticus TaxID=76633 RepID=A0ABM8V8D4_THEXY|nr:AI-2E family transporter [Thermobacillus xylanilyticus]CAG5092185.1 Sporulation integral membrane protein YtvI [Thermobacillus xylanilyticus]